MGMYDYLGGEQVKLFYKPIFSPKESSGDKRASTWHSGGGGRSFGKKDKLPLKTLYYQYPKNFLVYDFRFEYEYVWIVKNGRFFKIVPYLELKNEDIIGPVFNYYGRELNISLVEDFFKIKREYNEAIEEDREMEFKVFPNGVIGTIKNNYEEFKQKEKYWNQVKNNGIKKFSKWLKEDSFSKEKNFGEAIDVYLFHREQQDEHPIGDYYSPKKNFLECKSYVKSLIEEDEYIAEKYKNWLNDDKMLQAINFPELINEVLEPNFT